MRVWPSVLIGIIAGGSLAVAQRGEPSPGVVRDPTAQQPQMGTARLAGRVLAEDTNGPLRRALVEVTTGSPQSARWVSTNADGRWELRDVAPGHYTVTVSRDGYVKMQYGQQRPFGLARTIDVA